MAKAQRTSQPSKPQGPGPHGHKNPLYLGHYHRGCRCEECKQAVRVYARNWAAKKREEDPNYFSVVMTRYRKSPQGREQYKRSRKSTETLARCAAQSRTLLAERRRMLAAIKTSRGCADCGYNKHWAALDFDHVRGEKFSEISVMGTLSLTRIMEEVAKCDVVCYRCHRVRTRSRLLSGESEWARKNVQNPSENTKKIARYRSRGRDFLSRFKVAAGCKDCGYNDKSEALDFDHVRGEKEFDISQRVHYPISRIKAEIAKCEVVCANCHRIRTFNRRRSKPITSKAT
jgi:hypothetical protein